MKICPRCGKENSNNSVFCGNCGKKLDESNASDDHDIKKKIEIKAVITGILAIALIMAGIILFIKQKKENDTEVMATTASSIESETEPVQESVVELESESESQVKEELEAESEPQGESKTETEPETESESEPEQNLVSEPVQESYVLPNSIPDEYYVYEGHTYGFYNAKKLGLDSYYQVSEFCREQGGHLATIDGQKENNYLFELVRDNFEKTAFFGYSDEDEEGNWQWEYGDSDYDNWTQYGQRQPDNGVGYGKIENYAEFNYERGTNSPNDGTWNDAPFRRNTNTFICEWEYDVVEAQNG